MWLSSKYRVGVDGCRYWLGVFYCDIDIEFTSAHNNSVKGKLEFCHCMMDANQTQGRGANIVT